MNILQVINILINLFFNCENYSSVYCIDYFINKIIKKYYCRHKITHCLTAFTFTNTLLYYSLHNTVIYIYLNFFVVRILNIINDVYSLTK